MKYFSPDEFLCTCGCGLNNIDYHLVEMLDHAREFAAIPFIITSGCRCQKHNEDVGGSKTSSHLYGLAVDIKCETSYKRFMVISGLLKAGFTRIGIGKDFIHADIDMYKPAELIWLY